MDGVQGEAYQGRLDHGPVDEGRVQVGRVEGGQPIPQGEVRRRGLLRLDRYDAANGLDDAKRLPVQEQLAPERGPVELSRGEGHARNSRRARWCEDGP